MTEEKNDSSQKEEKETKAEETTAKDNSSTQTEAEEKIEVPAKFKNLIEEIEKMSVLDLAELVKILEKKFGVSATPPAMMVAAAGDANNGAKEQAEEKTSFNVELTNSGSNKIAVIKAIRLFIEVGLKDAKDLVDSAPKVIKEDVKKEEAEEMKKKLEEAGGKVTLK